MKIAQLETSLPVAGAEPKAGESGFGSAITDAIAKVDGLQVEADQEATKVARGDGNLHELSLSLEKADVAMRVAVKVRNKLVDAYNEVMRMSV
ncbi:MAG: flagellar hook-basal body complex protein FliE [Archangiaceae bacterium]|nr:flagellar hook-basal body complex protein FliE [Archangiaceae bacterium]